MELFVQHGMFGSDMVYRPQRVSQEGGESQFCHFWCFSIENHAITSF